MSSQFFESFAYIWQVMGPYSWLIGCAIVATIVLRAPLPGRAGLNAKRDPWRGFRFAARDRVLARAAGRCEAALFLVWGRCSSPATEVDHVFPWSRRGATIVSNGQAMCSHHNRSKGSLRPPWWYILGLERRRREYFPAGESVRVFAGMSSADLAARKRQQENARARKTI